MNDDTVWIAVLAILTAWLVIEQGKHIRDLEEDVDLLIDGDTALAAAKRKLAGRRVSRETERTRL